MDAAGVPVCLFFNQFERQVIDNFALLLLRAFTFLSNSLFA